MTIRLAPGVYETLINVFIEAGIVEAERAGLRAKVRELDIADSHEYFAHYLADRIRKAFASFPSSERLAKQIELANKIVLVLSESTPTGPDSTSKVLRADLLLALSDLPIQRADTPLSTTCLMTGTRQDPSLVSQLRKEISTANRVDILCSFIKWGGIRLMEESFRDLTKQNTLRVITTSYMGATDLKAVDFLQALQNTELRVSYDTRRTRLHAKAYIIHRDTGFGVAYIGSSNLSQAALTDGLEWNVKISEHESPHLWEKIKATFDTYWSDNEFVPYSSATRERLREALHSERSPSSDDDLPVFFDIKPYSFQQEILDKLVAERVLHSRFRNLVVAATGTGKTVVSAFDYRRFKKECGETRQSRLLFVAHREEILKQSIGTFRAVFHDYNFGDLLVAGSEPESLDHLFCSIQSFNSRRLWEQVRPDFYDYVVVDEFHHAAAPSYQRLLEFVDPRILLGLTATPERMDDLDVFGFFGNHIAAEIRLPDAINRKLLCPFHYFGVTDAVDFSGIRWQRGGYDLQQLDNLVTGNDARAKLVIDKTRNILLDIKNARGLGFCVSIRHAEYMASAFNQAGITALALSADSPREARQSAKSKLIARHVNFIFVVDLYNEGVDIPEVDTILLLRPTESLTVFLQQLGRGLRLHEDKECLTVLDFIGQAHQNFSFETRFRALIGQSGNRLDSEVEEGFPHLPAGCVISLERIATKYILDNVRQATTHNRNRLVGRIRSYTDETGKAITLRDFIEYHRLELDDIYRRASWSRLLVDAGLKDAFADPDEDRLTKGIRRLAHINAARYLEAVLKQLSASTLVEPEDELLRRYLLMAHFCLWGRKDSPETLPASLRRLQSNPTLLAEIRDLLRLKLELLDEIPIEPTLPFLCPLQVHADYTRDEILAGLGVWTEDSQPESREGLFHAKALPADLFFVTLNKSESDYSPTTMYEDYAISDELFHWQSQSTTSVNSPTAERYINHAKRFHSILLFVREDKRRNALTMPYTFLGPVDYVAHEGSRPVSIIWRLRHKLPAKLIRNIRRLANE